MTEAELNIKDKLRLKADIKITIAFGLLFSIALIILVVLIPVAMDIFGKKPSEGYLSRCLYIVGLLLIPFLAISWTNTLKVFDLRKGKKLIFKTENYEVINKKNTAYILTHDHNKQKIKIHNELIPLIKTDQPLTIEISNFSKSLLYVSHDQNNLLD